MAAVKDLTNMLDYASEEAKDMDEEIGAPAPVTTGWWTATSTYDVYMVDTPNDRDNYTPNKNGGKSNEASKRQK